MGTSTSADFQNVTRLNPIEWADRELLRKLMTNSRPGYHTALISYTGNALEQGGVEAHCLCSGTCAPIAGAWDFDTIAQYQAANPLIAKNGPLAKGGYVCWFPTNEKDMMFRDHDDFYKRWLTAGWAYASEVSDPDQVNVFRYEVSAGLEGVSKTQIGEREYPPSDLVGISNFFKFGAIMPKVYENPTHMKAIRGFFSALKNGVVHAARWTRDNWGVIQGVGAALAPLIL
jgi:hypothetical protein